MAQGRYRHTPYVAPQHRRAVKVKQRWSVRNDFIVVMGLFIGGVLLPLLFG